MTLLTIRTSDLQDHHTGLQQMPCQTGPIRASAFHPDTLELAVTAHPRQHPPIARRRDREACDTGHTTNAVHDRSDMLIQMCVDPTDNHTR